MSQIIKTNITYLPNVVIESMSEEESNLLAAVVFSFQSRAGAQNGDLIALEVHLLRNYYKELTMLDVQLAFEYAAVGKLANWNVTRKTIKDDVCAVMNAYRAYLLDAKKEGVMCQDDLEVIKRKDKEAEESILALYQEFVRGEKEIQLYGIPAMESANVWDTIVRLGIVEDFELENEKEYFEAQYHKLKISNSLQPKTVKQISEMWADGLVHEELKFRASHEIKAKKLSLAVAKRRDEMMRTIFWQKEPIVPQNYTVILMEEGKL